MSDKPAAPSTCPRCQGHTAPEPLLASRALHRCRDCHHLFAMPSAGGPRSASVREMRLWETVSSAELRGNMTRSELWWLAHTSLIAASADPDAPSFGAEVEDAASALHERLRATIGVSPPSGLDGTAVDDLSVEERSGSGFTYRTVGGQGGETRVRPRVDVTGMGIIGAVAITALIGAVVVAVDGPTDPGDITALLFLGTLAVFTFSILGLEILFPASIRCSRHTLVVDRPGLPSARRTVLERDAIRYIAIRDHTHFWTVQAVHEAGVASLTTTRSAKGANELAQRLEARLGLCDMAAPSPRVRVGDADSERETPDVTRPELESVPSRSVDRARRGG